jgi:hypothetical protein
MNSISNIPRIRMNKAYRRCTIYKGCEINGSLILGNGRYYILDNVFSPNNNDSAIKLKTPKFREKIYVGNR